VSAVNKTCGSCVQHLGRTAAEQRSRWPTEAFRIPESSYSKWAKKSGRWVVEWVVCGQRVVMLLLLQKYCCLLFGAAAMRA